MRIAICDDNQNDQNDLKLLLNKYAESTGLEMDIDVIEDDASCISQLKSGAYDLIFLDIYLKESYGTKIAAALPKNIAKKIVFTTCSMDYAVMAFSLNALHYLIKPITSEDIYEVMCRLEDISKSSRNEKVLTLKHKRTILSIPFQEIMYIETFNKLSIIHTIQQDYEIYISLSALLDRLDPHTFVSPQRSYAVNLNYVRAIQGKNIILKNKIEIPISRSKRDSIREEFENYLFGQIRQSEKDHS